MSFISLKFAVFFILLLLVMVACKDVKKQKLVLLTFSYIFYALGDWRFLFLLIFVSISMWFIGRKISEARWNPKACLIAGVVLDVVVLGVFKYFNFFAGSFAAAIGRTYTELNIVLPLGISFYIFQSISYIADVYNKKIEAEDSLLDVLLYIGFFPQIVSGPIVKAHYFLPQLKKSHSITWTSLNEGLQLFLLGLFKKVVIADRVAVCVDAVYAAPNAYSSLSVLFAVLAYALQIYCDFSGYSDMAIGVATVLGFDLGKNFNLPYLAKNPSDFWRRWHISLSSWFRDYVYFPLGGSRKGKAQTYLNLFITMLLSGLWHGASWGFIIWGVAHAALSVIHKMFCDIKKKIGFSGEGSIIANAFAVLLNYICVATLWIIFRTNSVPQTLKILKRIFACAHGINYLNIYVIIYLLLLIAVEIYAMVKNDWNNPFKPLDLGKFWNKVVIICFVVIIIVFSYVGDTAFIYAKF